MDDDSEADCCMLQGEKGSGARRFVVCCLEPGRLQKARPGGLWNDGTWRFRAGEAVLREDLLFLEALLFSLEGKALLLCCKEESGA